MPSACSRPPGKATRYCCSGVYAEGVLDLEVGQPAVGAVGVDEEPAVAPEEGGGHALVAELRAREAAQHRGLVGHRHGAVVVRALPRLMLPGMARRAGRAADVGRRGRRCRCRRRRAGRQRGLGFRARLVECEVQAGDEQQRHHSHGEPGRPPACRSCGRRLRGRRHQTAGAGLAGQVRSRRRVMPRSLLPGHRVGNTCFQSCLMLSTVQPRGPASSSARSSLPMCDLRS